MKISNEIILPEIEGIYTSECDLLADVIRRVGDLFSHAEAFSYVSVSHNDGSSFKYYSAVVYASSCKVGKCFVVIGEHSTPAVYFIDDLEYIRLRMEKMLGADKIVTDCTVEYKEE